MTASGIGGRTSHPTKTNIIAGATGYIGKAVVQASVEQGYRTIALVRDRSKVTDPGTEQLLEPFFSGAEVVECDVTDEKQLQKVRKQRGYDASNEANSANMTALSATINKRDQASMHETSRYSPF